jgi:hypothetical protein
MDDVCPTYDGPIVADTSSVFSSSGLAGETRWIHSQGDAISVGERAVSVFCAYAGTLIKQDDRKRGGGGAAKAADQFIETRCLCRLP